MAWPKLELAASTERSTSAELDLTRELASLEAEISAFWALSALVWMSLVAFAVAELSVRSISVEIARIWLAASAEVEVSEVWASRALLRMVEAVSAPKIGRASCRERG